MPKSISGKLTDLTNPFIREQIEVSYLHGKTGSPCEPAQKSPKWSSHQRGPAPPERFDPAARRSIMGTWAATGFATQPFWTPENYPRSSQGLCRRFAGGGEWDNEFPSRYQPPSGVSEAVPFSEHETISRVEVRFGPGRLEGKLYPCPAASPENSWYCDAHSRRLSLQARETPKPDSQKAGLNCIQCR